MEPIANNDVFDTLVFMLFLSGIAVILVLFFYNMSKYIKPKAKSCHLLKKPHAWERKYDEFGDYRLTCNDCGRSVMDMGGEE